MEKMALIILNPSKSINKAFRKQKPHRAQFDNFKLQLKNLLGSINERESEEYNKNLVRDFLSNTFYNDFNVNTKGRTDLVVYLGKTNKIGIIIETKNPSNNSEMVRSNDVNKKAMHEAILYYFRERIEEKNDEIKNIIITNNFQWFIFDAQLFEKLFYKNKSFKDNYISWNENQKVSSNTDHFYNEIAKPFLENLKDDISFTYFDLKEYRTHLDNDKKLIPLFKVFSRTHLLKESFANDSNSLDKQFYNELLHIIGLEERKEGSKKVINRKKESKREAGALLENTISILKTEDSLSYISNPESFGETPEEQIYSLALELNITWINRILFLKLLEGQLLTYHKGNKDYKFLDEIKLKEYDDLYELFHKVLALSINERDAEIKSKYKFVPYLNSSLFEISKLERNSIRISQLQDHADLSILKQTKLRDNLNKKRSGALPTLTYLLQFLDAYDFATESNGNEIQEEGKTLISASVLGLIFEKINGYKEGSFFTPGFITMYMARETIRRAVVQKFNTTLNVNFKDFEELKTEIDTSKVGREKANSIINSLKICDPAVGSGHFLVSALNEIIVVKSELGVLTYTDGRRVLDYNFEIENDELIITNFETENIFEYHLNDKNNTIPHLQNLQETLFHEKQTIIENSLFGVDINPNSVNICRLRLWIELLKNAYYTNANGNKELQTLPNIDINIKQGNSLVSRFNISDTQFAKGDKRTLEEYKLNVAAYKNVNQKAARKELKDSINNIRTKFIGLASDPLFKEKEKLTKLASDLHGLNIELFGADNKKSEAKQIKLESDIKKLSATIELKEKENEKLFKDAFEWRFEFPEVLDDEGKFIGFDVVIGNPPYFPLSTNKEMAKYYEIANYKTYTKSADIYCLFYERGSQILKESGFLTFITSNSWIRAAYGEPLKNYFTNFIRPTTLLNIEDVQLFEEATVESNIITLKKESDNKTFLVANLKDDYLFGSSLLTYFTENNFEFTLPNTPNWVIGNESITNLKLKIEQGSKPLKDFNIRINFGIKTGLNEAFIIDEQTKNKLIEEDIKAKEIIKPILRGRDLRKYESEFSHHWVISTFPSLKISVENYPSILEHLLSFGKPRLRQSGEKGSRKKTSQKWFETQDSISYWKEFEKPKIVWGEISDAPKFVYDDSNYYAEATTFIMTGEKLKYLLAILNSKVSEWYFKKIGTTTGMGTNRWKKYKIELLPIKVTSNKNELAVETLVNQILVAKQANPMADTSTQEEAIDKLVYKLYNLTPEEIKIIELS